eukprot:6867891-Pyramimonas_sp.AAC.1
MCLIGSTVTAPVWYQSGYGGPVWYQSAQTRANNTCPLPTFCDLRLADPQNMLRVASRGFLWQHGGDAAVGPAWQQGNRPGVLQHGQPDV